MFRGAGMDEDNGQGHTKGGAHVLHNSSYFVFHFKIKGMYFGDKTSSCSFSLSTHTGRMWE